MEFGFFDPSLGNKERLFLVCEGFPSHLGEDLSLLALHVRELFLEGGSSVSLEYSVG